MEVRVVNRDFLLHVRIHILSSITRPEDGDYYSSLNLNMTLTLVGLVGEVSRKPVILRNWGQNIKYGQKRPSTYRCKKICWCIK